MEPILKYKLNRCAKLLAESALDEEVKDAILENISKATEEDLDNLIKSLEREQYEFKKIRGQLEEFEKDDNEAWRQLEKKQEELAERMGDEFLAEALKDGLEKTD